MATKRSSKAVKSAKNRSKRIPSVKRLDAVRTLKGCDPIPNIAVTHLR